MRDRPFGIIGISGFASRLWGNRSCRFEFDIGVGNPAARFEAENEDAYNGACSVHHPGDVFGVPAGYFGVPAGYFGVPAGSPHFQLLI